VIFTKPGCPHCARAKSLLEANGVAYEEVMLGKNVTFSTIRAVSGRGTAPQVFIGGRHIGGADDVAAYFSAGQKLAA
jgi:glutaredoxin-like protein